MKKSYVLNDVEIMPNKIEELTQYYDSRIKDKDYYSRTVSARAARIMPAGSRSHCIGRLRHDASLKNHAVIKSREERYEQVLVQVSDMRQGVNEEDPFTHVEAKTYELLAMIKLGLKSPSELSELIPLIEAYNNTCKNSYRMINQEVIDRLKWFKPYYKNYIFIQDLLSRGNRSILRDVAVSSVKGKIYSNYSIDSMLSHVSQEGCIRATFRYKNLYEIYAIFMSKNLYNKSPRGDIEKRFRVSGVVNMSRDSVLSYIYADSKIFRDNKLILIS